MKIRRYLSTIALLFAACACAPAALAQTAHGSYQFAHDDGRTKYVEFEASAQSSGGASGHMFFSDDTVITEQDTDGVGDPVETYPGFYFSADFDEMLVTGAQAVMSGTVRDSSIRSLIGRRVLLTVEDNGENGREPDHVTWGVYANTKRDWVASDSELRDDPGVGMSWTASDAELKDDRGVRMPLDDSIGVRTFPLASYEFVVAATNSGDIVVKP